MSRPQGEKTRRRFGGTLSPRSPVGGEREPPSRRAWTESIPLMKFTRLALFMAAMMSSAFATISLASDDAGTEVASPIYGITIPKGYRHWELVAPSHVPGFDELRGILGNELATIAYRDGTLPFPDGTVIAKLSWKHAPSTEFNGVFSPGPATSVQFMVKDPKKYASTGGWGFGKFIDGKPTGEEEHKACFACHEAHAHGHDFVFTHFAP